MTSSVLRSIAHVSVLLLLLAAMVSPASASQYGSWSTGVSIETLPGSSSEVNTAAVDGCPIQSPDGLSLYMASTRLNGVGGIDLWVAHRSSTDVGFGTPENLGAAVNSTADDFCPTPVRGKGLFFVSTRGGNADIYFTRKNPVHGWEAPVPVSAVNSGLPEFSPSYFEADGRAFLYFSRGPDIYSAELQADGSWGAVGAVASLNSAADDFRPNVRKDGLEIVFDSNRGGAGGQDLYFATRASVGDAWGTPVNAGGGINTPANETRGSFSWDALTLVFGRAPAGEGMSDIFVSTRAPLSGN